jgi:ribosomal protein S18 acetylase RimI-like enzyme
MVTENIEIVPATMRDFGDMQQMFRKMFELYHVDQDIEYPYTDAGISYLKNCIDRRIALVAKDKKRTVGFLTGGIGDAAPFKTYQQQGHIHNLFVLDEYRGQGIGKRLIQRFVEICKGNAVHRIITDSDDIEALRRFYVSLGFCITGIIYEMNTANN